MVGSAGSGEGVKGNGGCGGGVTSGDDDGILEGGVEGTGDFAGGDVGISRDDKCILSVLYDSCGVKVAGDNVIFSYCQIITFCLVDAAFGVLGCTEALSLP